MSFDGLPRPAQMGLSTGGMNPYAAANAARTDNAGKPLVKSLNKEEKVKALQKEQQEYHQPDEEEERGEAFSEEEAEQIKIMAKMRGVMGLALKEGQRYEFQINAKTGLIDLVEVDTQVVILQMQPEELMALSQKIQRYAGMLTDRAG